MNILAFATYPKTAIQYYRTAVPIEAMADLDLNLRYVIDDFRPGTSKKERNETMEMSDIIQSHLLPLAQGTVDPLSITRSAPIYDPDVDELKYPPTIVVDIDDAYDHLSPTNPSFGQWGVRTPEGGIMTADTKIMGKMADGTERVLWHEGKVYDDGHGKMRVFSLQENWGNHAIAKMLVERSTALTVSTPYLNNHYRALHPSQKNVFTFPNCVMFKHYPKVELREHPGEVRILWQGGSSHMDDFRPICRTLAKVIHEYENTRMIIFGQEYPWLNEMFPQDRFEHHKWVPFEGYQTRLSTLGHDINLCPLVDSVFNRSKSAIKWYESTAISRPAATLAGNVVPYHEIEDGKTGMLYNTPEEFEDKLCALIESEKLRKELTANAVDWIHENRDAMKEAPKLYQFYQRVREEHMASFPVLVGGTTCLQAALPFSKPNSASLEQLELPGTVTNSPAPVTLSSKL